MEQQQQNFEYPEQSSEEYLEEDLDEDLIDANSTNSGSQDGHEEDGEEGDEEFLRQKKLFLKKIDNSDPTIDISTLLYHKKKINEKLQTMESANNIPGLYFNEPLDPKCTIKKIAVLENREQQKQKQQSDQDEKRQQVSNDGNLIFDRPISPISRSSKCFNSNFRSPSLAQSSSSSSSSSSISSNNRIFNMINKNTSNPAINQNLFTMNLENLQPNLQQSRNKHQTTSTFFDVDYEINNESDSFSQFWQRQQQQNKSYSNLFTLMMDDSTTASNTNHHNQSLFNFRQPSAKSNHKRRKLNQSNSRSTLRKTSSFFSCETINEEEEEEAASTFSIFGDDNESATNTTMMDNFLENEKTFRKKNRHQFSIDMGEFPFF